MERGELAFADALREAIDARGLSLDRVRAHLLSYGHDVSVATLSYWQTGRSTPVRRVSLQAIGALEVILQVPRGHLAGKLPTQLARRRGDDGHTPLRQPADFVAADEVVRRLGIDWGEGYSRITHDELVVLGPGRVVERGVVANTLVATRDGLDRMLVGYYSDIPGVLLQTSAGRGCRVGRTAVVMSETMAAAELVFDQPLRAGDPYRLEHVTTYDTPGVYVREVQHAAIQRVQHCSVTLRVAPDDPPDWVETFAGGADDPVVYSRGALRGDELTLTVVDASFVRLAIRWGWDDDPAEPIQPVRPLVEE